MSQAQDTASITPWHAFKRGLTNPSGLALSVTLAIPLGLLLWVMLWVNEAWFASDNHRWFADSAFDDATFVSARALTLGYSDPNRDKVIIVGASATRVAMRPEMIRQRVGDSAEIYPMATGRQTFWESQHLLSRLPQGSQGIVFVGLGPSRLTQPLDSLQDILNSPRVAFRSETFDNTLLAHGFTPRQPHTNYALDNASFLLARVPALLRNLVMGPPTYSAGYLDGPAAKKRAYDRIAKRVAARWDDYDANHRHNLDALSDLIAFIRARSDMQIVLLEHPMNPAFEQEYLPAALRQKHQQLLTDFAQEHQVQYWQPASTLDFSTDAFYDWAHLRDREAANQYTRKVMQLALAEGLWENNNE
ncbi:hypothetical protein LJ739_01320 [Aestuariibacter halophilus]|uniref:SGNH hydrolase-type esterase domain-containing protein n=1 Tax=Fluctibacter halophilus TaxID=226011 RepID=A0ABS8G2R5_9ALTE|nr:hypothetical protein [Aestuariibacter halophilus]MCC2614877.1 hypothetical protein [Aestuariibacter halophilus]